MSEPEREPEPEPVKVDAVAVANAAGSLVTRTLLGLVLGFLLGLGVFILELTLGAFEATGASRLLVWLLLPLYALSAAAVLAIVYLVGAVRAAASRLLVDSGVLRRTVERGLARIRRADEKPQQPAGAEPAPRGWLGARLHGMRDRIARALVDRLRTTAAPEAETSATIDQAARMMIDEWSETPVYLAIGALVLLFAVPPFLL